MRHLSDDDLRKVAYEMQAAQGADLMQAAMVEIVRNASAHRDEDCFLCVNDLEDECGEYTNGVLLALAWKAKRALREIADVQPVLAQRESGPATACNPA